MKFANELLVAASENAVAIVQPRDNETVNQSKLSARRLLNTAQRTVAASSKLVDVNRERQVAVRNRMSYEKGDRTSETLWPLNYSVV